MLTVEATQARGVKGTARGSTRGSARPGEERFLSSIGMHPARPRRTHGCAETAPRVHRCRKPFVARQLAEVPKPLDLRQLHARRVKLPPAETISRVHPPLAEMPQAHVSNHQDVRLHGLRILHCGGRGHYGRRWARTDGDGTNGIERPSSTRRSTLQGVGSTNHKQRI